MSELFSLPFLPVLNLRGLPSAAAKVYFYLSGTSTLTPIYADAALTTQRTNPVVADNMGRLPSIYLDTDISEYRIRIVDAINGFLAEADPYSPFQAGPKGDPGAGGNVAVGVNQLQAVTATAGDTWFLSAGAASGNFIRSTANLSTKVAADPFKGIYVAPASDPTGASGAWVRDIQGDTELAWFGVGAQAANNAARIESAVAITQGGPLLLPAGDVPLERQLNIVEFAPIRGKGKGKDGTRITHGPGYSAIRLHFTPGTEDAFDTFISQCSIVQTSRLATTATGSFDATTRVFTITGGTNDFQNGQVVCIENAGLSQVMPGKTAAISSGSNIATITSVMGNPGVYVGQRISIAGANLPTNTTVTAVSPTTITVSNNAAATVTAALYTVTWPAIGTITSGGGTATLVTDIASEAQNATGVLLRHYDAGIVLDRTAEVTGISFAGQFLNLHTRTDASYGGHIANTSKISDCRFGSSEMCTHFAGFDGNANNIAFCDYSNYTRIGAYETSLIGNHYTGCHFAYNMGFVCPKPANNSTVMSAYIEDGTSMIGNANGNVALGTRIPFGVGFSTLMALEGGGWSLGGGFCTSWDASDAFYVDNVKVVGNRGAPVPDATGGANIDVEARAALNALLARARTHGLIA